MTHPIRRLAIRLGALYLRHSPFKRGRYRISSLLLPWLREDGPSMGRVIVRTRHGFRFHADLNDWLGQYVYLTGDYEPPTAALFEHLVQPGDTVVDVGANAGFFSLLCAALVGPAGRVLAFEPIPDVRERLRANVNLNAYRQIEVRLEAVSNRTEEVTIYEGPAGHKGLSSMRPLESANRPLSVAAVTLDDMATSIDCVTCMKIDVEGAEFLVLLGMARLLERDGPDIIIEFTEKYLRSFDHSVVDIVNWLHARGYRLWRITDDGLIPLDIEVRGLPAQYNVLACRKLPAGLAPKVVERSPLLSRDHAALDERHSAQAPRTSRTMRSAASR